jgi:hypothetical protein
MIKTYKLTQPLRNSSFVLRGKTGNPMRYNFSGGDPLTGKAATLMLRSQYAQTLLEESEPFKQGYVKLWKTEEGGENVQMPEIQKTIVEDVTSPEQLIEYVATNFEKVYQRPDAALEFARKKGYEFPNLELKKPE